jgi:hypothetical protein
MNLLRTLLAASLAVAVVSACSGDGPDLDRTASGASEQPSGSAPAAEASASAAPPAAASPAPVAALPPQTLTAPAFPANTATDTEEPAGGILGVTAMRAARQQGYDRVVFQLGGKERGAPGWRVEYTDQPTQDGSGDPVKVAGSAFLSVVLTGTGYPMDTGTTEPSPRRLAPKGTGLVKEVVFDGVFEGQTAAFIGLSAQRPFRVFRLADPARVVVDIRHR